MGIRDPSSAIPQQVFLLKYVDPFCYKSKSELKEAKAKGDDGWEILNRKSCFVRHVAAVICRENLRMLSNGARMRMCACAHAPHCPAGSRVVASQRRSVVAS
eukprot:scaffold263_cov120-Isochrysis_galbana.AAC.2